MPRACLIALLLVATFLSTRVAATEPASACLDAADIAERNWTLPPNLIHAIGRAESGRFDPTTGRVAPWPWTVNADGRGFYFTARAEAVAFVRALQSRGVRLIDVGCFQVDLFYHPAAFSSLEQAFDPISNADYAARFLTTLHGQTGSWAAAIAGYHSSQAIEGETYRQKVMAQWGAGGVLLGAAATPAARHVVGRPLAQDQFVVLMSATARAIPVIRP
ncbi:transglycosylase SLT domain-containing protein [Rhodopila sp.]|uniref:transglycosylase SLT domain-containing protein n=1 Tax=Rhodopila sp. TaxID=2480087 RepID=UPI003D0D78BC